MIFLDLYRNIVSLFKIKLKDFPTIVFLIVSGFLFFNRFQTLGFDTILLLRPAALPCSLLSPWAIVLRHGLVHLHLPCAGDLALDYMYTRIQRSLGILKAMCDRMIIWLLLHIV